MGCCAVAAQLGHLSPGSPGLSHLLSGDVGLPEAGPSYLQDTPQGVLCTWKGAWTGGQGSSSGPQRDLTPCQLSAALDLVAARSSRPPPSTLHNCCLRLTQVPGRTAFLSVPWSPEGVGEEVLGKWPDKDLLLPLVPPCPLPQTHLPSASCTPAAAAPRALASLCGWACGSQGAYSFQGPAVP